MGISLHWQLVSVALGKIPIFGKAECGARRDPQGLSPEQGKAREQSCTSEKQGNDRLQKCKVLFHRTRKDKGDTAEDEHAEGECTRENPAEHTAHSKWPVRSEYRDAETHG